VKTGASELWKRINKTNLSRESVADLSSFKSGKANYKIALWNPETNGVRYLKLLLFNLAADLAPADLERLRRTRNRSFGRPLSVRVAGQDVCLDYLQASLETGFLSSHGAPLDGADIVEIGAGYGRTAHTILSNHDARSYTIVDLDNCLDLSRRYLKRVLDARRFSRLRFARAEAPAAWSKRRYDLAINIDSFAEMDPDTVRDYLAFIRRTCSWFYAKNPVGKYTDPSLESAPQPAARQVARRMGLLRRVIDVNDQAAVAAATGRFLSAYRPRGWAVAGQGWARPWTFYWQALFRKEDR
jgi:putative sugar O-methyltransferase